MKLQTASAIALCTLLLASGCVSNNKSEAQARAAFFAGQRQALEMVRQAQLRGPSVTVIGEVKNAVVPWTADLTLAKALVAADYRGATDPKEILIERGGKAMSYDPTKLLSGEDVPLEAGDIVVISR